MAKVVTNSNTIVTQSRWSQYSFVAMAAGLGAIWWALSAMLRRYAVDPVICTQGGACADGLVIAGNIALAGVAILGIFALLRMSVARPLVVALASGVMLWNLGGFIAGLSWYEALGWSVILFILSYVLFWLIARMRSLTASLITTVVVLILVRVALLFW